MRVAVEYSSTRKEVYKVFCEKYKLEKVDYVKWKNIIYTFNEMYRDYLLETGNKEKLSSGFGEFGINKRKRKTFKKINGVEYVNLPIDWQKTKEKGKVVYNMNYHTEGYAFNWVWFKPSCMIKIPDLWHFRPSRTSSRLISHYIKTDSKYQDIYKQWIV